LSLLQAATRAATEKTVSKPLTSASYGRVRPGRPVDRAEFLRVADLAEAGASTAVASPFEMYVSTFLLLSPDINRGRIADAGRSTAIVIA